MYYLCYIFYQTEDLLPIFCLTNLLPIYFPSVRFLFLLKWQEGCNKCILHLTIIPSHTTASIISFQISLYTCSWSTRQDKHNN